MNIKYIFGKTCCGDNMNESVWRDTVSLPKFPTLKGEKKTDVLIIGGGICGVLLTYFLEKKGIDCILAEKEFLCGGATGNTTGKITFQHSLIFDRLIKSCGKDIAEGYLDINIKAVEEYKRLCKNIDCDFEIRDNYVYSLRNREKIEKEIIALERLGFSAKFEDSTELPIKIAGAVRCANQAQFNPLKFIGEIAKGLNIYENTKVCELKKNTAITENGSINAENIVVATHFPFINKHGGYFLKMYQHRSYVLGLCNAQRINGMYVDEDKKGMSLRSYGDILLLGGGGHRTGKNGGNWNELKIFADENYKNARVKYMWAAQDCISLDGMPYIGKYSAGTHNLFVASGFNKWGISGSMVSAMLLSDALAGEPNPYLKIFNTSRSILKPQLLANVFESVLGFATPTVKRCPHLGCALRWNRCEHSWDCSCHGSRFSEKGRVLDNPANNGL